jgi:hypothetical protein
MPASETLAALDRALAELRRLIAELQRLRGTRATDA